MTSDKKDDARPVEPEPVRSRQWIQPRVVAYGPISKLTRGGSGSKKDGTVLVRA